MARVFLSLGSNLADRETNIANAINLLNKEHIRITRTSPIYETSPVGHISLFSIPCPFSGKQNNFLNCVVEAFSNDPPNPLLAKILKIEKSLHRQRIPFLRNLPRTIDIDILFYNDMIINQVMLKIPHPRLHERLFVLLPLADLEPDFLHPILHKSIRQLLNSAGKKGDVLCQKQTSTISV